MSKFGEIYLGISEMSRLIGWSRQRLTYQLNKANALVQLGNRRVTTRALLKAHFPDIYRLIVELEHVETDF